MSDRELLEMAAKAAGIQIVFGGYDSDCYAGITEGEAKAFGSYETGFEWNPLTGDGDALRLAVKLNLCVDVGRRDIDVIWSNANGEVFSITEPGEKSAACPYATTRRAIVIAAAEIGKAMEG